MFVHRRPAAMLFTLAALLVTAGPSRAASDTALRLANVSAASTAYVRVPNNAAFALQTFTLEAWVQRVGVGYGFTTDTGGAGIIAKPNEGNVGTDLTSWHLDYTNSGQIIFNLTHTLGSAGVYASTPALATPLGRHHLAATFDGATVQLYVDGVPSGSAAWSLGSVYYGADDVLIGANNFGAGYLRRFDGFIDDVRVWDHALTAAQVASSMNCALTGSEAGLVAYWSFDGSNLSDLTGHGHNGTAVATAGSLTYASLSPLGSCTAGVNERTPSSSALSLAVFPQPARQFATVSFVLPRPGPVTVDVMDVAGRSLAVLDARDYAAGPHTLTANLATALAGTQGSGVMFVRVRSGGESAVRTLVVRR